MDSPDANPPPEKDFPAHGAHDAHDAHMHDARGIPNAPDGFPGPLGSLAPRKVRDTVVMTRVTTFTLPAMPRAEFLEITELIAGQFGIRLGENKLTLVTGRIHPMMEKYGFATHRECLDAIKRDATGRLLSELANRISTNHTAFFREESHFERLRETILPEIAARKRASGNLDLRVWCAACATGEEAYTLLFAMLDFLGGEYRLWRAGLLATDISADALAVARRGVYNGLRLEPVPAHAVSRFFDKLESGSSKENDIYEVKPELRKEITFRRLNLTTDRYPFRQRFDVIFCRNVMIYFSRNVRMRLLSDLRDWLEPGGYLFVGHSESLVGSREGYEYVAPAVYRKSE